MYRLTKTPDYFGTLRDSLYSCFAAVERAVMKVYSAVRKRRLQHEDPAGDDDLSEFAEFFSMKPIQRTQTTMDDTAECEELNAVEECLYINEHTSLAVMEYVYEPDLKAVIKIITDDDGLSEKSWKRAVRFQYDKRDRTKVRGFIVLNNRQYYLRVKPGE